MSTIFNIWLTYSTIVKLDPIKKLNINGILLMNMKSDATVIFPILSFNISGTSVYSDWTLLGCWWIFFPFEGGYIAAVNSVRIENVINGDRAIIYGTYHLLKHFL